MDLQRLKVNDILNKTVCNNRNFKYLANIAKHTNPNKDLNQMRNSDSYFIADDNSVNKINVCMDNVNNNSKYSKEMKPVVVVNEAANSNSERICSSLHSPIFHSNDVNTPLEVCDNSNVFLKGLEYKMCDKLDSKCSDSKDTLKIKHSVKNKPKLKHVASSCLLDSTVSADDSKYLDNAKNNPGNFQCSKINNIFCNNSNFRSHPNIVRGSSPKVVLKLMRNSYSRVYVNINAACEAIGAGNVENNSEECKGVTSDNKIGNSNSSPSRISPQSTIFYSTERKQNCGELKGIAIDNKIENSYSEPICTCLQSTSFHPTERKQNCEEELKGIAIDNKIENSYSEPICTSLQSTIFHSTGRKQSCQEEFEDPNQKAKKSLLQQFSATIILLSIDSFIAETVIESKKANVFCLKSSYHCDKHDNCSNCFDLLEVGDKVFCYLPPTDDTYKLGNMCFAFMVCKDTDSIKESNSDTAEFSKLNERYTSKYINIYDSSSQLNPSSDGYFTVKKNMQSSECQTAFSGVGKPICAMFDKECQAKFESFSLGIQVVNELHVQDCQTDISGNIKCCYETESLECQTLISGPGKRVNSDNKYSQCSCITSHTSCQVKPETFSLAAQTVSNSHAQVSQTDISGDIKNCFNTKSCESQTWISYPINKKRVDSASKYHHSTCGSDNVQQTSQPSKSVSAFYPISPVVSNLDFISAEKSLVNLRMKRTGDMSCQTLSTGDIFLKNFYM